MGAFDSAQHAPAAGGDVRWDRRCIMHDLLTRTFYGNTIRDWLVAMGIILASIIVAKMIYWLGQNLGRRLTAKTNTKLDDILLDLAEEPFVGAVVLFGIWLGVGTLTLSPNISEWVAKIFHVAIAIVVGWLLSRLFDSAYQNILVPIASKTDTDLDDQLLPIVRRGSRTIIWTLAIIVGLNNAGYNIGALLAGLGIGGLALAMAAKDTVSNMFGGFTIFYDQPFKLNERIKINGIDGIVEEIGLRSTRIRTLEGRLVTIPNATFSGSPVENVSREPTRKKVVTLGLTYDMTADHVEKAMAILKEVAAANEGVEEEPKLGFNSFGDFSLNILLIYYIKKDADILGTETAMNLAILRQFTDAGLDFAFPTQTVLVNQQQAA
jgi:MscS family membrane protein